MRGARLRAPYRAGPGLTPAGAGSTDVTSWLDLIPAGGLPPQVRGAQPAIPNRVGAAISWAYPRRCGEHVSLWLIVIHSDERAYPRRCGEHVQSSSAARSLRAYPRRCGEHRNDPLHGGAYGGLPPQVRGALMSAHQPAAGLLGLTPAGAGSTAHPPNAPVRLTPAGAGSTIRMETDRTL